MEKMAESLDKRRVEQDGSLDQIVLEQNEQEMGAKLTVGGRESLEQRNSWRQGNSQESR